MSPITITVTVVTVCIFTNRMTLKILSKPRNTVLCIGGILNGIDNSTFTQVLASTYGTHSWTLECDSQPAICHFGHCQQVLSTTYWQLLLYILHSRDDGCAVTKFLKARVWDKFQREVPLFLNLKIL